MEKSPHFGFALNFNQPVNYEKFLPCFWLISTCCNSRTLATATLNAGFAKVSYIRANQTNHSHFLRPRVKIFFIWEVEALKLLPSNIHYRHYFQINKLEETVQFHVLFDTISCAVIDWFWTAWSRTIGKSAKIMLGLVTPKCKQGVVAYRYKYHTKI